MLWRRDWQASSPGTHCLGLINQPATKSRSPCSCADKKPKGEQEMLEEHYPSPLSPSLPVYPARQVNFLPWGRREQKGGVVLFCHHLLSPCWICGQQEHFLRHTRSILPLFYLSPLKQGSIKKTKNQGRAEQCLGGSDEFPEITRSFPSSSFDWSLK